ncbi:uncharacterized protein LOC115212064 isoform X1 [Octopus sinensis]|uniref:Uncharacterized protein LOC115212064 isoform X1 n=2 Tax=Octopus sinensis TaxID=2607531 RepID=A0A6P7SF01_9MOLL|nr:uncharacterized protein LOC115212064 isoform X1 [Octopus sinensis]
MIKMVGNDREQRSIHETSLSCGNVKNNNENCKETIKNDCILMSIKMEEEENSEEEESNDNISNKLKSNIHKDNADSLSYYADFLNNIFRCQYCKFSTTDKEELNKHRSVHSKEKQHKCSQCDYECHYRADLIRHCAKHSDEKRYKCPHCDFATKWRRNVRHHLLKHTNERPYQCQICEFSFKRLQDLKYHMYRHNDEKPIKCDECEFCCKTNYELKCHKLKHSDVRRFPCTFEGCTQQCKTKSDLTKHLKTHNGEKNHICSLCGKGFTTAGCLNKHVQRHDTRKQFICHLCLKKFKSKASLKNHLKIHEGIRPFVCDICEKSFTNKYNMMKHQETHGDNRPFRCPICPYGARSSEHLLAHIGSMHGHSYAYFCELCKKPFRRHGQLRIHLKRMHKGSKEATAAADFTHNSTSSLPISRSENAKNTCDKLPVSKSNNENKYLNSKKTDALSSNITKQSCLSSTKPVEDKSAIDVAKTEQASNLDSKCPPVSEDSKSGIKNGDDDGNQHVAIETTELKPTKKQKNDSKKYVEGFHLPLATKGFTFNFEKKGKKPRSWFMDPNYMPADAAEKQKAYLNRKAKLSKLKKSEAKEKMKQKKKLKIDDKPKQSVIVQKTGLVKASKKKVKLVKNLNTKKMLRKKNKSKSLKKCIPLTEGCKVKIESLRSDFEDDVCWENKLIINNKNNQMVKSVTDEIYTPYQDIHPELSIPTKIKQEPTDDPGDILNIEMPSSPVKTVLFETLLKSETGEFSTDLTESVSTESKIGEMTETSADYCDNKSLPCNNRLESSNQLQITSDGTTKDNTSPLSPSGVFKLENLSIRKTDSNKTMLVYTISQEIGDTCQSSSSDLQITELFSSSTGPGETVIKQEPIQLDNYSLTNQINSFSLNPNINIKMDKNEPFLFDQEKLNSSITSPSQTLAPLSESNQNNQDKELNDPVSSENLGGFEIIDSHTNNKYYIKPFTTPNSDKTISLANNLTNDFSLDGYYEKIATVEGIQDGKLTLSHSFNLDPSKSLSTLDKNVHNNCDSLSNSVSSTSTMENFYSTESVISQEVLPNHSPTSNSSVLSLQKLDCDDVTLPVTVTEKEMSLSERDPFQFSSNLDFGHPKYHQFLQTHNSFHDTSKCNDSNILRVPHINLSNKTEKGSDLVYPPTFHPSSILEAVEANQQVRTSANSMAFNSESNEISTKCPVLLSTLNSQFFVNEPFKETSEKLGTITTNNILPKPPSDEAQALYEYEMEFDEKSILRDNINITMLGSYSSEPQEKTNPFSVFSCTNENNNLLEMTVNSDLNDNVGHKPVCNDVNLISAKPELDWDSEDNLTQNYILLNPSC